jgi:hypothetical protein
MASSTDASASEDQKESMEKGGDRNSKDKTSGRSRRIRLLFTLVL